MIYALHHAVTLVLGLAAIPIMLRGQWQHATPRIAVAVWQAITATVTLSLIGLLFSIALVPYGQGVIGGVLSIGDDLVRGTLPPDMTLAHWGFLVAAAAVSITVLGGTLRTALIARLRRRRLRDALAFLDGEAGLSDVGQSNVGQSDGDDGDTREVALRVLPHAARTVFCIPGGPGTIVLSTAARQALEPGELAAVLAHELAHLRARHDLVLLPAVTARRMLPFIPVTDRVLAQVEMLIEMCADDAAARRHGDGALLSSIDRLVRGTTTTSPEGALAVTDTALSERRRRLARRPRTPSVSSLAARSTVAAAMVTTPISLFVLPL